MIIKQITSASNWYAKIEAQNGQFALEPVACWALIYDDELQSDRVVGMIDCEMGIASAEETSEYNQFLCYCTFEQLSEEDRKLLVIQ